MSKSGQPIYTLLARLLDSPPPTAPVAVLGDYSTKAGDFRNVAWRLVCSVAPLLPHNTVKRYLVSGHTFHLRHFEGGLIVLCLTLCEAPRAGVSHFMSVVHSQVTALFARSRRRRRRMVSGVV